MGVDFGTGYIEVVPQVDKRKAETAMTKQLSPSLASAGKKMVGVGAGLTAGLTLPIVAFGKSAVSAFQESETAAAQTRAAIKSTGGAAKLTAGQVADLANSVADYSGVDDEVIQRGADMLLTFTKVRDAVGKGRDIFTEATKAGADLAARGFGSIESNATLLGKALQDPAKGLARLVRVGVDFSDKQKDVITRLADSGKTAKAQGAILDNVFKQVGGSAAAFGRTTAGEMAIARKKFGDAMEGLGGTISSVLTPILTKVSDILGKLINWFTDLPGPVKTVGIVLAGLAAAAGPVLVIMGSLAVAIGAITAPIAIAVGVIAALAAIAILVAANWGKVKAALEPIASFLADLFQPVWESLRDVWTDSILPALKDLWSAVKALWPVLKIVLIVGLGPLVIAFIALAKLLPYVIKVVGFLIRILAKLVRGIAEVVGWLADKLGGAFADAWEQAKVVFEAMKDGFRAVKSVATAVWDAVWGAFKTVVNTIAGAWNRTIGALSIHIPDIPGLPGRGSTFDVPDIPTLAAGGIVTRPTLAVVGESGTEAVVPLSSLGQIAGSNAFKIAGTLALTEDSEAYIAGVASREDEVATRRGRTVARMNPKGRAS